MPDIYQIGIWVVYSGIVLAMGYWVVLVLSGE